MEALKFAYQHPLFSAADLELIFAAHQRVDLNKGDFILEEGQIAQAYYVLEEGLIRSFLYDYHGHDITTGFVGEKEVVIEVSSFFQRIPTQEYMQCISDCQLWKINYRTFQDLFHQIPAFREWGRAWMAYELYLSKKRATEMIRAGQKTLPSSVGRKTPLNTTGTLKVHCYLFGYYRHLA